jgi:hypothetical protein
VGLVVSTSVMVRMPTPNDAGNVVVVTGSVVPVEVGATVAGDVGGRPDVVAVVERRVAVVHELNTTIAAARAAIRPLVLVRRHWRPVGSATP